MKFWFILNTSTQIIIIEIYTLDEYYKNIDSCYGG